MVVFALLGVWPKERKMLSAADSLQGGKQPCFDQGSLHLHCVRPADLTLY
jgi:hypothetical protein